MGKHSELLRRAAIESGARKPWFLNTGASSQEIHRMASAFEHDALIQALALP